MSISLCVRAFIRNPKGEFLLVKHKEDRPWTLPGGHVEEGELYDLALERELWEEFQIKVKFDSMSYEAKEIFVRVQPLPLTIHSISYKNSRGELITKQELFYAVTTNDEIQYQQASEIFAWKWRSKEEIINNIHGHIYPNIVEIVNQKF
jgi:8-oxo-dGTP pyrophosphatase MutT (NUDIX family)